VISCSITVTTCAIPPIIRSRVARRAYRSGCAEQPFTEASGERFLGTSGVLADPLQFVN
jgi:hypothetical protein